MGFRCFWAAFFLLCCFFAVGSFDQDGFLSLSCGGTMNYIDSAGISWVPDGTYINTGNTTSIDNNEDSQRSSDSIRFFPEYQDPNCYRLPVNDVLSSVLVRAKFVYRNYDGLGKPPTFSISLGTAIASTVNLTIKDPWNEEYVWPVTKDTMSFCLHAMPDGGNPVISSIEIRPLPQEAYKSGIRESQVKLLRKCYRVDCGYTNGILRYPSDPYDRIWDADLGYFTPFHLSAGFRFDIGISQSNLKETPPFAVLQSARVLARSNVLSYNLPLDTLGDYYIVLYFAGILPVFPSFHIIINGNIVQSDFVVRYSEVSALDTIQKGIKSLNITLISTSFCPQINAFEVYEIINIPSEASSTTVSALQVIQQSTGLDLGWQDDPCSPTPWDHIECEGSLVTSLKLSDINLRSISPTFGDLLDLKILDLHNTSLAGPIQNLGGLQHLEKLNLSFNQLTSFGTDLSDLASLQILDLQHNSLEGMVPDSLGELNDLHLLNLENNKLQGILPQSLHRGSLEIRTLGNLCLSFSTTTCNVSPNSSIETPQVTVVTKKKHSGHNRVAIIVGAVVGGSCALLSLALLALLYRRKKRRDITNSGGAQVDMQNWTTARVFSYKEIKTATNNFKEVIGRGSFGSVYLGKLSDSKLVAVKVRFDKTQLGADSFINEVRVLSQIRHQNLVSLEGFCHESKQQIVVYEYLPGGSLADSLYGLKSRKLTLSWIRRLKIAVDAAKGMLMKIIACIKRYRYENIGVAAQVILLNFDEAQYCNWDRLDYLHNGSNPRIIHRDVKCSNILLDLQTNAKVCDFGLSKQITQADATHITTVVKGTAGYLDPEYYSTQQLTEKSDIYSFGVVLLELICGREPLSHSGSPDSFNLVLWAKPYLQAGAFEIVDDCLKGEFDAESMRKATSIAIRSVERDASRRPTIAEVLVELKEAYAIQLAYLSTSGHDN